MWSLLENLRGPIGPSPIWVDVPYNASNFYGSGTSIWTVESGDIQHFSYAVFGKVLLVELALTTTSISVTSSSVLSVRMPDSYTAYRRCNNVLFITESGNSLAAYFNIVASSNILEIRKVNGNMFAKGTNTLDVLGQIAIRIN